MKMRYMHVDAVRPRRKGLGNSGEPGAQAMIYHPPVQWLEDLIKADPFFQRSRVRFRVPPWVSKTIARDLLALHRRRPCELRAIV